MTEQGPRADSQDRSSAGRQPDTARRWKIGVAGLRRGMAFVRLLSAMPDVVVVGVADPDEDRRTTVCRSAGIAAGYPDLDHLLEAELDIVVIATPLPHHCRDAMAALARGVHVLSEVTAASTLDECLALLDAVERSDRQYMMAENCCYWAFVEAGKALYRQGAFGDIFYAEAEYLHDVRGAMRDASGAVTWRGEMAPIIYCTHSVGPLLWITGQYPTEVVCLGSGSHFMPGVTDLQTALIRLTDGGLVRLTASFANRHWGRHRFHLMGTRGTLDTGWVGRDQPRFWTDTIPHLEGPMQLPISTQAPGAPPQASLGGHGTAEWYMVRAFLDSLAQGTRPPIDVYDSVMYTLAGLCARESAAAGGRQVAVPQLQERRSRLATP